MINHNFNASNHPQNVSVLEDTRYQKKIKKNTKINHKAPQTMSGLLAFLVAPETEATPQVFQWLLFNSCCGEKLSADFQKWGELTET